MPASETTESESPGPAPDRPRTSWAPLFFILASLIALGAVPLLGRLYVRSFEKELREWITPARDQATELHLALALGAAALRDYLDTDSAVYRERYSFHYNKERAVYAALAPLASAIGGLTEQRYQELRAAEARWHERIADLMDRDSLDPQGIHRIISQEELYDHTLIAAARLDDALSLAGNARRRHITAADRAVLVITLALCTLAVAAGVVAGRLGAQLRRYATDLETSRAELERVMESKTRMTRGITHDLKNPLGVIIGHAQLLEEGLHGQLTAEQQEGVQRISGAAISMLELIDTLLEMARADAGQLKIAIEPVDLAALVREVAESYRTAIEQEGLAFDVNVKGPIVVQTDPARVAQVLGNLLSNARKYTGRGQVTLRASRDPAKGRKDGRCRIDVVDTGPGIPEADQEKVFQEFSRLTSSGTGVGLGLAISRRIARLLGGDVTVQSRPGQGATFTLLLPEHPNGHPAAPKGIPATAPPQDHNTAP